MKLVGNSCSGSWGSVYNSAMQELMIESQRPCVFVAVQSSWLWGFHDLPCPSSLNLTTHSALFKGMFAIGNTNSSPPVEKKSDVEPIILEGEQQATFDLFLHHVHSQ